MNHTSPHGFRVSCSSNEVRSSSNINAARCRVFGARLLRQGDGEDAVGDFGLDSIHVCVVREAEAAQEFALRPLHAVPLIALVHSLFVPLARDLQCVAVLHRHLHFVLRQPWVTIRVPWLSKCKTLNINLLQFVAL